MSTFALQFKGTVEKQKNKQTASKMGKSLDHIIFKEGLRELALFSLAKSHLQLLEEELQR